MTPLDPVGPGNSATSECTRCTCYALCICGMLSVIAEGETQAQIDQIGLDGLVHAFGG